MYLMLLGGLVALWPTHNTNSHVRVRPFRPHQRPPRLGCSRAEHASASRPSQQPIRPSRARAPAGLRFATSNNVRSWKHASRRQTRRARCPLAPLPSSRTPSLEAQSPPQSLLYLGTRVVEYGRTEYTHTFIPCSIVLHFGVGARPFSRHATLF